METLARRRAIRAAAAASVAAALVAVLAACSGGGPAGSPTAAPQVEVSGRPVPYQGPQAWSLASIPTRASTRLSVFAVGSDSGGGPCGPPVLRLAAEETASEVRVLVAGYQEARDDDTACPAIAYAAQPQAVVLRSALGDRRLVDAASGSSPRLLVGSDYPNLPSPPANLGTSVLGYDPASRTVSRSWSADDGASLRLETAPPSSARRFGPSGRIVRQVGIRGASATVYRSGGGRDAQRVVQWTPSPNRTLTLRLDNGSARRWTDDEAVEVARSVTGYRTSATDRLPVPATPGTVVAVYSSADGQVLHAPNLLKSSGVHVGVNCQGEGLLHVAMRGTVFQFSCASGLRHFGEESIGDPDARFFLDISATDGVRWTVTLARASLDGS